MSDLVEDAIDWPDLDDLRLLLEPYGIEVTDIPLDGLRIMLNNNRGAGSPTLALEVSVFERNAFGIPYLDETGKVAKLKKTIPLAGLPTLTPRI